MLYTKLKEYLMYIDIDEDLNVITTISYASYCG